MSLRKRSTIFAVSTIAFVIALVYLVSQFVILEGFEKLENERTLTNVKRAVNAVNAEVDRLHVFTADWAYWDDTYNFVKDKNETFIESNLVDSTFVLTGINVIIIRDNDGNIVYEGAFDLENQVSTNVPMDLFELFAPGNPLATDSYEGASGILVVNGKPMVVSARQILTSNREGPSRGILMMGFFIQEVHIEKLAKATELALKLKSISEVDVKSDEEVRIINSDHIEGLGVIKDIYGERVLAANFVSERNIFKEGQKTVSTLLVGLFAIGIVVTIIGIIYLEKAILSRLFLLLNEVNTIGNSGEYSGRVSVRGRDEIGLLSKRINLMLEVLERSEETRLSASIDSLPLGFFIVDKDHLIVAINPAMMYILETLVRPQRLEELKSYFGANFDLKQFCADCRPKKTLFRVNAYSYKKKILSIISVPIIDRANNNFLGTAVIIDDITESKMLERAKDEFLAIASHELRTPLTVIRGNLSLIQDHFTKQVNDPSLSEMFKDIHESSVRLIKIVNDFLDVSRLEQETSTLAMQEVNVSEIIQKSIKQFEAEAKEKDLYLKFDEKQKLVAFGNGDLVRHIVDNLVQNAISFTEAGGVVIKGLNENGFLKVSVVDSGVGILPENQKLLFHKFQQAGSDVRRRDVTRGTGLGLYLSKLMVEKMGGKISLDKSEIGKGSTFSFALPLAHKP